MTVPGDGNLPLAGLRVLELAHSRVHYCGKVLADLGADVVKMEPPEGDIARRQGPFKADIPDPELSLSFLYFNANKRGIVLDLETAEGQETLRRLAARTHALIEGFTPGYLEERGLGYAQLRDLNPGLVMASVTPFGQTGPCARYRANDLVCAAMGGMMFVARPPGMAPLALPGEQTYQRWNAEESSRDPVSETARSSS